MKFFNAAMVIASAMIVVGAFFLGCLFGDMNEFLFLIAYVLPAYLIAGIYVRWISLRFLRENPNPGPSWLVSAFSLLSATLALLAYGAGSKYGDESGSAVLLAAAVFAALALPLVLYALLYRSDPDFRSE